MKYRIDGKEFRPEEFGDAPKDRREYECGLNDVAVVLNVKLETWDEEEKQWIDLCV